MIVRLTLSIQKRTNAWVRALLLAAPQRSPRPTHGLHGPIHGEDKDKEKEEEDEKSGLMDIESGRNG